MAAGGTDVVTPPTAKKTLQSGRMRRRDGKAVQGMLCHEMLALRTRQPCPALRQDDTQFQMAVLHGTCKGPLSLALRFERLFLQVLCRRNAALKEHMRAMKICNQAMHALKNLRVALREEWFSAVRRSGAVQLQPILFTRRTRDRKLICMSAHMRHCECDKCIPFQESGSSNTGCFHVHPLDQLQGGNVHAELPHR